MDTDAPVSYTDYHNLSMEAKDVDPGITALRYLADRFELNTEQRYWLAFLYACTYTTVSVFYIYNEFPDPDRVDLKRLERWWNANKRHVIFQTDRRRIKNNDQFVPAVKSYMELTRGRADRYFNTKSWKLMYERITAIHGFGRFSVFNHLDAINTITHQSVMLPYLDMRDAVSCRSGIAWSMDRPDLVTKGRLPGSDLKMLHNEFIRLLKTHDGNVFQVETTLCAYAKYRKGQRYIGYYIERMRKELKQMEATTPPGVCWDVLWQFRQETFDPVYLGAHESSVDWGMWVRQDMGVHSGPDQGQHVA